MSETNELAWYWKLGLLLLKLADRATRLFWRKPESVKPKRKRKTAVKPKAKKPKAKPAATRKPKPKKK